MPGKRKEMVREDEKKRRRKKRRRKKRRRKKRKKKRREERKKEDEKKERKKRKEKKNVPCLNPTTIPSTTQVIPTIDTAAAYAHKAERKSFSISHKPITKGELTK